MFEKAGLTLLDFGANIQVTLQQQHMQYNSSSRKSALQNKNEIMTISGRRGLGQRQRERKNTYSKLPRH
jgi:hypothetical protein